MCGTGPNLLNIPETLIWFLFYTNEIALIGWVLGIIGALKAITQFGTDSPGIINNVFRSLSVLDPIMRGVIGFIGSVFVIVYPYLIWFEIQKAMDMESYNPPKEDIEENKENEENEVS